MRVRLAYLVLVALLVCVPAVASTPTAAPDHVHLSWRHDPATTSTVLWRTDRSVEGTAVEWGTDASLGESASGTHRDYGTNNARMHEVELTGLTPDTVYFYRAGSPSGWSDVFGFATPPADACTPLRFVVLGDSRSNIGDGPSADWDDMIAAAGRELPDFILINGDLIKEGNVEAGWDAFLEAAHPVLAQVAFLPAWGNHDDRDGSLFPDVFATPSGPEGEDYFGLDVGPLFMAVLDTEHGGPRYAAQAAWLAETLPARAGKWTMAMGHRPVYSSGSTHGSDEEAQQYLLPVFDAQGLDVYFGSHDHTYERGCVAKAGACVADPANGTRYFVTGGAGAFMNPIGGGQWFTEKFFAQFHYVLVEIAFDTITIEARDRQGVTLDEVSWSQPVIAQPYAVIQATPNPATAGEPVHFDGTLSGSCGGSITGYSWRMGTGDVAFDPAFDYAYAAPGSYEVVLTVTDNDAQTAEARATIVVEAAGGDDAGDDSAPDDDDEGDDLGGDAGDDDDGCGC